MRRFRKGSVIDVSDGRGSRDVVRAPGSRILSYPAEQNVPDQDASCEANWLKAVGGLASRKWLFVISCGFPVRSPFV